MATLPKSKLAFTTGEIASMLDVNINTVVRWFEAGYLRGFKLPSSDTRRVSRNELLAFIDRHKLSKESRQYNAIEILLVSSHQNTINQFRSAIESAFGYEINITDNAFEAGLICASSMPDVVFVHLRHSNFDPAEFWRVLVERPHLTKPPLIAVVSAESDKAIREEMKLDGWLQLPVKKDAILDHIDAAVAKNSSIYDDSNPRQWCMLRIRPKARRKYNVRLTKKQRGRLKQIILDEKASKHEINRAKILLKTDAHGKSWSNNDIASSLSSSVTTVVDTQRKFVQKGLEAAIKRKKSRRRSFPRKFDDEKKAQLISLSRSNPPAGYKSWTLKLLANKLIELGIVESISRETVRKALKNQN